jgi:hypothetical protein
LIDQSEANFDNNLFNEINFWKKKKSVSAKMLDRLLSNFFIFGFYCIDSWARDDICCFNHGSIREKSTKVISSKNGTVVDVAVAGVGSDADVGAVVGGGSGDVDDDDDDVAVVVVIDVADNVVSVVVDIDVADNDVTVVVASGAVLVVIVAIECYYWCCCCCC